MAYSNTNTPPEYRISQNLVEVVRNVKPQAMLLLDANTIMDFPKLSSYQIAVPGTFLLVIPQDVGDEILKLKHRTRSKEIRQKAASALKAMTKVYGKGNPEGGIQLQNDLWVVTVPSVRNSEVDRSVEDDQVRRLVGRVDSALIRLTEACKEIVPTILVTRDIGLKYKATEKRLTAFSLPDLRKAEAFSTLLISDRRTPTLDLDTSLRSLLSNEEKPVKVPLTLEELRSEGDYLIARGSGIITWHSDRYPFRWKFPYKNAEKIENLESWFPDDDMSLENLDFFGRDEQLPEPVRRRVCFRLEEQAVYGRLQPPSIRAWIMFGIMVDSNCLDADFLDERIDTLDTQLLAELGPEDREIIDKCRQYAKHVRPLLNGTAKLSVGSYMAAFEAYKALTEQVGEEPVDEEPINGITSLFDSALDSWSVGSTIESETSSVEKAIKIINQVLDEEGRTEL